MAPPPSTPHTRPSTPQTQPSTPSSVHFYGDRSPTAWDPVSSDYCTIIGRICSQQPIESITVLLDYHIPPDGIGEQRFFPTVQASIEGQPEVTHSVNVPGEPAWTICLGRLAQEHLQRWHFKPEDASCHMGFLLELPVGSAFFMDRGAGTVTRWFGIRYKLKSLLGEEYSGEEDVSVTSVNAGRSTEAFM